MKIISREGWGADEPSRSISSIPLPVPRLVLHHTVTKDEGTSSVLKVQRLHMRQGFSDIGYNWVYSPRTGQVYVGRGPGVVGAHTRGYNTTAHALAILGDGRYDDLSPDHIDDLAEFRVFHGQYGPDHFTHGHRDLVATACPGDNFYACIDQINATTTDWFDMATKDELHSVVREVVRDELRAANYYGSPLAHRIRIMGIQLSRVENAVGELDQASHDALVVAFKDAWEEVGGVEISDEDILRIVDATIAEIAS